MNPRGDDEVARLDPSGEDIAIALDLADGHCDQSQRSGLWIDAPDRFSAVVVEDRGDRNARARTSDEIKPHAGSHAKLGRGWRLEQRWLDAEGARHRIGLGCDLTNARIDRRFRLRPKRHLHWPRDIDVSADLLGNGELDLKFGGVSDDEDGVPLPDDLTGFGNDLRHDAV